MTSEHIKKQQERLARLARTTAIYTPNDGYFISIGVLPSTPEGSPTGVKEIWDSINAYGIGRCQEYAKDQLLNNLGAKQFSLQERGYYGEVFIFQGGPSIENADMAGMGFKHEAEVADDAIDAFLYSVAGKKDSVAWYVAVGAPENKVQDNNMKGLRAQKNHDEKAYMLLHNYCNVVNVKIGHFTEHVANCFYHNPSDRTLWKQDLGKDVFMRVYNSPLETKQSLKESMLEQRLRPK